MEYTNQQYLGEFWGDQAGMAPCGDDISFLSCQKGFFLAKVTFFCLYTADVDWPPM